MKLIALVVLAASCSLIVSAAVHSEVATGSYWDDAFAPGSALPQICLDIGCVDANLCFIAGGSNGAGFGIYGYDGQLNGQVYQMNMNNASMIIMAVEAGGTASSPHAASGGMGTFFTAGFAPEHYYEASSSTWQPSASPFELAVATPSLSATSNGMTAVAIDGGMPAGLLVSTDGARTYALKPLTGYPGPDMGNCSTANVVEVIGDNTWFVILGQEPQTASSSSSSSFDAQGRKTIRHKNRDITLDISSGSPKVSSTRAARADPRSGVASGETCVGYSYQVIKTTDGGSTYTVQMQAANGVAAFTFLGIDCIDAEHCVMIGGNQMSSVVYMTSNGGQTWSEVYTVDANANGTVAFSAVAYVNASDIWIGGELGEEQTQTAIGVFYYSRDGGRTWFEYSNLQYAVATVMSLTFPSPTVGFATGITQEQSSSVLKYAPQPYYGYFAQKQCLTSGCDFLCEQMYFPQGMCLQSSTGGIVATCSSSGLEIKSYVTTGCIGSYNSSTAPINTCLQSSNGGALPYFENLCNVDAIRKEGSQHSKAGAKMLH